MTSVARLNVLLEYVSRLAEVDDIETFFRVAADALKWVLEFEQGTLALRREGAVSVWCVSSGDERFLASSGSLPPEDAEVIAEVEARGVPVLRVAPAPIICQPLVSGGQTLGTLSLRASSRPYTYEDMRIAGFMAQSMAGTLTRLLQAATIEAQNRIAVEHGRLALEGAQAANRAKDDFLALLGHELRNPLAPILIMIESLKRKSPGSANEIAIIERQTENLVRIIDDLIDVAKVTRGKITLDETTLDMNEVVGRAVEMTRPLFDAKRHDLRVEVPASEVVVRGDRARLVQVVSNLLSNAAKYTDPEGTIQVRGRADAGEVVLEVQDSGSGIPRDIESTLFEPFVQGRQEFGQGSGGLGLGLALVKRLVDLHRGSVAVSSLGPGLGSVFTVRLPRERLGVVAPEPPRVTSAARAPAKRILVVDDNQDLTDALAKVLTMEGHQVAVANDAAGALKRIETFTPDVALLDIGLPSIDGRELGKMLRARFAGVVLIALSGYGEAGDRKRSLDAGFAQHLVKPVTAEKLLASLASPLDR